MLIEAAHLAAYKKGTRSTYKSARKLFGEFCDILGADPAAVSERQLCAMTWMFCHSRSITGLDGWLSGVNKSLEFEDNSPLPRGSYFKQHKSGLKDIFGPIDVRAPSPPVDEDDLRKLRSSLDLNVYQQARFWFCTLLGFQGLLRAGEICAGRLRITDVQLVDGGLRIRVLFSKTNSYPVWLALTQREDGLCPVQALEAMLSTRPGGADERIYPESYNTFNSELKRRFKHAGVIKDGLTSHAMRRGGATALFMAGASTLTIMAHGRWSSNAWMKYIELGFAQQLLATQLLHKARSV